MAHIISIALQKGGTAKTTTAVNLSANLTSKKKHVLLIDLDSQANATFSSGLNTKSIKHSSYNLLTSDPDYTCSADDAITKTEWYDLIPADKDVMDLPDELQAIDVLKTKLQHISDKYDYIVIDCPPALNRITINSLVASDSLIIPTEPKPFNFTGLVDMTETIKVIHEQANPSLRVLGILLVKHNRRTNLSKMMQQAIDEYTSQLNTSLYDTTIREGVAVPESQLAQQPLSVYAPSAKPTIDYKAFTTETLQKIGDL